MSKVGVRRDGPVDGCRTLSLKEHESSRVAKWKEESRRGRRRARRSTERGVKVCVTGGVKSEASRLTTALLYAATAKPISTLRPRPLHAAAGFHLIMYTHLQQDPSMDGVFNGSYPGLGCRIAAVAYSRW